MQAYPLQLKIDFLSINPPVYDLLAKAKEVIEKFDLGNRPAIRTRTYCPYRGE